MKTFAIFNGRTSFWQWDVGQKLIVNDSVCCEVHFCNGTTDCALVSAVYEQDGKRLVNVPNVLLQSTNQLHAFAYIKGEGDRYTMRSKSFFVLPRSKPDDYVYTETEVWTAEKAVAEALEEIQLQIDDGVDTAEWANIKAEIAISIAKGRATGYVFDYEDDMLLWLEDEANKAKLVLGDNLYIRDIGTPDYWWDGKTAWPLETQKVDLEEYAKFTDYASNARAGTVRIYNSKGLKVDSDGVLSVYAATEAQIKSKQHGYNAITPQKLDYATVRGVAHNTLTLTDTEQKQACSWLGTIMVRENPDGTITATLPSGKSKTIDLSMIEIFL